MTEHLALIPLARLHPHPENVRRVAVADDAMVASIGTHGLIDPLLVAPDPDHADDFLVLDGMRRLDGCQRAELPGVWCRVREDLVTLAQQVEVMAITGLQKETLSPVEEAAAYEQLTLLGMDEAAIVASTGYSAKRVRSRLRLSALPEDAQQALHDGQASLMDVQRIDEFADDPVVVERLERALADGSFALAWHEEKRRRRHQVQAEETIRRFEDDGLPQVADVSGAVRVYGTDAGHDGGCLGYYVPDSDYDLPYKVCVDPARHDTPAPDRQHVTSDWEKARAAREERRARFAAAGAARAEWIHEHLAAQLHARGHGPLGKFAAVLLPVAWVEDADYLAHALGADNADDLGDRLDGIAALSTTKVLSGFAGWLAQNIAVELDRDHTRVDTALEARRRLNVWDWLTGSGYRLTDVDVEQRTLLESRFAELTDEEEAGDR